MRATSKEACWRSARAASAGTSPVSASASLAASSTASPCSKRFSSPKIRPISGRVYRGIIFQFVSLVKESINKTLGGLIGRSLRLGNHQPREQAAAVERLRRHQAHDLRVIIVRAQMAQDQRRGAGVQLIADEVARYIVRQMPVAPHDALLQRPRVGADLQHLDV